MPGPKTPTQPAPAKPAPAPAPTKPAPQPATKPDPFDPAWPEQRPFPPPKALR